MVEIWDAYDKNFCKIENVRLVRGEVIPEGIYHLGCEIIVKHIDGTYLLMQRYFKKHLGGMWELTAGGSALINETPIECAIRELKEETGIESIDLKEIRRIVHKEHYSLFVEYLCIVNCKKNSIILQEGETINYKWVAKDDLLKMEMNSLASSRALILVKELNI